jgi:uncharacterized protein YecA (UPF0149 family)
MNESDVLQKPRELSNEELEDMQKRLLAQAAKMRMLPTRKNMMLMAKKMGIQRNDPCGCGSGKKFKKCCLNLI